MRGVKKEDLPCMFLLPRTWDHPLFSLWDVPIMHKAHILVVVLEMSDGESSFPPFPFSIPEEEPEIVYPFDVIVENEIITVESEEDLDRLKEVCD